jgi:hypothetical protein
MPVETCQCATLDGSDLPAFNPRCPAHGVTTEWYRRVVKGESLDEG